MGVASARRISVLILLALAGAFTSVQAERKPVTTVEGIVEHRLDNGLQVLLFPDPSKPTFTVNITYFVGSRHEGRGEKGMAHLLEHMVFKGTPNHPDIWRALEDHGARFNGTTWVDRTNYYETLPSEPANLDWALGMEADRMINSKISADDLSREFSVVRNEFEMGENNPVDVLWERMVSTAYIWHSYGHSTIGSRSDIERVPVDNLRAFYQRYYQPDNAMLVVAGDFDPAQALTLIDKHFGPIPKSGRKFEDTYTIEPVQDGARHVELQRVGEVGAAGLVYHIPPGSHEDYAALDVLEQVLVDEPAGRLYKALVATGRASSVMGTAFGWREPSIAIHIAEVPAGQPAEPVLQEMIATIESLGPITDEEVGRAKRALEKSFDLAMKDSRRVGIELSEWAAAGDWRLMFLHRDRVSRVTTDQVRRVASTYFKESNRTSGLFKPQRAGEIDRAEIPQAPEVASLLSGYTGRAALSEGEQFEATPENIESRVTRRVLPNGMKLALLPKETRGDAVNAALVLRFGSPRDLTGRMKVAELVPAMLTRGTSKRTYQQIQDRLDELKATVNFRLDGGMAGPENALSANIRTERANLGPAIELVYELMREATFPADEFEIVKKEELAALEESSTDPQARAFNFLMRTLEPHAKDDVRYIPTIEEEIALVRATTADDLRKLHRELFGASHAQMTVIGDFDAEPIAATIERTFGSWKSPKAYARIPHEFHEIATAEEKIHTPDKTMAMVAFGLGMELNDTDPAYPALHLSNYVLGASAKSRLLDRLRQKEGLSYGAGSFLMVRSEDRDGMFAGMAIAAPENAQKAHDSMVDEVQQLVTKGIDTETLEDAKKSYALQITNRLSNDATVAGMLNEGLYLGRTMDYYKNLYAAVESLTAEQVKAALAEHVDLSRMVRVQAGDFDGTASATP